LNNDKELPSNDDRSRSHGNAFFIDIKEGEASTWVVATETFD
jgi:hypothetical protein